MEKFSIQSLPEIIVASHREVIPDYAAIGPHVLRENRAWMAVNYFHIEDAGKVLVRGVKDKGDINNTSALTDHLSHFHAYYPSSSFSLLTLLRETGMAS